MFHRLRDHFLRDRLVNRTNIQFRRIILFTTSQRVGRAQLLDQGRALYFAHFLPLVRQLKQLLQHPS